MRLLQREMPFNLIHQPVTICRLRQPFNQYSFEYQAGIEVLKAENVSVPAIFGGDAGRGIR